MWAYHDAQAMVAQANSSFSSLEPPTRAQTPQKLTCAAAALISMCFGLTLRDEVAGHWAVMRFAPGQ